MVQAGFRGVGHRHLARDGIEGSHAGASFLSVLAGVAMKYQRERFEELGEHCEPPRRDSSVIVTRKFDATPMRFQFGKLQETLLPVARFLIQEDGRWKAVPLSKYLEKNTRINASSSGASCRSSHKRPNCT